MNSRLILNPMLCLLHHHHRPVVLQVYSLDQQRLQHLGTCQDDTFSAPTQTLNQKLWGGAQQYVL